METWRVELPAGRKSLAEVWIQRGVFQGEKLSPLLFVIAMMPLNHILRKCIVGCKLSKSTGRQKTVYEKPKRIGNPNTDCENIQSRYRNGIWYRKMGHAWNEKRETTQDRRNRNTKSRKIRTLGEETYKYLGILEADTIKQMEMKEKITKGYLRRTRKLLETKLCSKNLIKRINTWAVSLERYSESFLNRTREQGN